MQRSVLIIGIIAVALCTVFSLQNPIQTDHPSNLNWHTDLNSALEEAKKTNKPIMVDFYAPWCSACRQLDEDTFSDQSVQEKLNKDYVIAKIDIDKNSDLASKYKIYAVPTHVFLDANGNEIKRYEGYRPPEEYLNLL